MAVNPADPSRGSLDAEQRKLVTGICVVSGAISLVPSTYNFVINPMLADLGATETQESLLRQLPSVMALLVIFLAGALATRIGHRRTIFASSLVFTFGCAIVAVGPVLPVVTVGLVCISTASSVMAVAGLGLLSSRIVNTRARATAFATFAIAVPAVYMIMPVAAGILLDNLSWRWVAGTWLVGGIILAWGSWRLLPRDQHSNTRPELWTPALAGLTLAAVVQTITAASLNGTFSAAVAIRAAVAVLGALLLTWSYRNIATPSLSLTSLRRGGMLILLAVVMIVPFVDLWFYLTVGYQYVYGMSAVQTAMLLVPAQLAGIGGALVARKFIQRRGLTATGTALLIVLSASLLLTLTIAVDSPIWLPLLILAVYAFASVGSGVAITNSVMDTVPRGEDDSASAMRGAAMHIGTALGVLTMTALVYSVAANSLTLSLSADGVASTQQSAEIAQDMRDGSTSEDASAHYAVPIEEINEIDDAQKHAMVDGLHAYGLVGSALIVSAAVIFGVGRRRQQRVSTPT